MSIDADDLRARLNSRHYRHLFQTCGFEINGQSGPKPSGILGPKALGEGENGNFSVDLERGLVKDWGSSGYEGDVFDVVKDVHGFDFNEALEWIVEELNLDVESNRRFNRQSTGASPTKRNWPSNAESELEPVASHEQVRHWHKGLMGETEAAQAARSYLTDERGLDTGVLEAANIGLAHSPDDDRGSWWIMIPVPDHTGGDSPPIVAVKGFAFNPSAGDWKRDNEGRKIPRNAGYATLYDPVPSDPKDSPVLVCEGELDALCAFSYGFNAVTGTAGAGTFKDEWAAYVANLPPAKNHGVVVAFDGDETGRKGAQNAAQVLHDAGAEVRVTSLPKGLDVSDILVEGDATDLHAYCVQAEPWECSTDPNLEGDPDSDEVGCLASKVETEPIEWLWSGRIPFGELTILDGDPGTGKSTLLTAILAQLTTGQGLPDHDGSPVEGGGVYVTTEDSPGRTICPRLEAAGANMERVVLVPSVSDEEGAPRPLVLPDDVDLLERAIRRVDARLVVIDPLMAHLGGSINAHRDADVRRALAPLADLGHRLGVAVVVVRHLNKSGRSTAIYRGGGSIGIIGAARVGLLLAEHPEQEDVRVLAPVKNNLAAFPLSQSLALEQAPEHDVARVEWLDTSNLTADELLQGSGPGRPDDKREEARTFLREILSDGPVPAQEVKEKADEEGIMTMTLRRAKDELDIQKEKDGYQGPWMWTLPEDDAPF